MRKENDVGKLQNYIKVSLIVPVYNTEEYLEQCLDSCVDQTLDEVEIIVVNDGSTDGSLRKIEEYAGRYDNINVISIVNSGLSVARNAGLATARGKYVCFCDSDDWMDIECLEQAYCYAEKYSLEIVTFDARVKCEHTGNPFTPQYNRFDMVDALQSYTGIEFVQKYRHTERVSAWLHFVRRDFLERHRILFLPGAIYEDHKFFMDCMAYAVRVRYLPHELYCYRIRPSSIMMSEITARKAASPFELCMGMLDTVKKLHIEKEKKIFWFDYIAEKIKELIAYSYKNTLPKEMYRFLDLNYDMVENLQYQFLEKFWNELSGIGNEPKNILLTLKCMENAVYCIGVISEREKLLIEKVYSYRFKYLYQELSKLPFSDEKKKIGIYGVGQHTRGLLQNYRKIVGMVKCQITYIDSNANSYTRHIGLSDIVNISDAASVGLDGIVISSFLHEKEMVETAKNVVGNAIPIYTIYDGKSYWIDTKPVKEDSVRKRLLSKRRTLQEKIFYVIAAPEHANTGDYLIAKAVREYLREYFQDYRIMEVTGPAFLENRDNIVAQISRLDTILVMGGGFFGSLWLDGEVIKTALQQFPDNKIVVLPQSLYFEDNGHGNKMKAEMQKIVCNHRNLTICYREKISLRRGKELFGKRIPQYVFPDMALFLKMIEINKERKGILLCLRTDEESIFMGEQRKQIAEAAALTGNEISETSMRWQHMITPEEADEILQKKLRQIAGAKLVVTDALHCVIVCALTGTPCIALPSSTGKTKGVYQWIKELPYIKYIDVDNSAACILRIGQGIKELLSKVENGEKYSYNMDFSTYGQQLAGLIDD